MLILAPPSEGKTGATRGRHLDLDELSFPGLTEMRTAVLDALVAASGRPDALEVLGAPRGAAEQVGGNRDLWTAPTRRAGDLYTGVLYDALGLASLAPTAKRRAARWFVVQSAAFGALRPNDRVPAYRLSMGVDLPGIGKLAAAWRPVLDPVMTSVAQRGLIVDLRSATYAAAWRPGGELVGRTVAVHVVRDGPGGPTAVSHMAKHTRGLVARHLLETGADPRTPEDLVAALGERFSARLVPGSGGHLRLEVTEPG